MNSFKKATVLLIILCQSMFVSAYATTSYFKWKKNFSISERKKIKRWLVYTKADAEKVFDAFDFPMYFSIFRRSANEPVPWAHTLRNYHQGVHLYVDPKFAFADFREDWTAAHEISHLVIPYLEDKDKWFAEGFASYFQYQVLYAGNNLSWTKAISRFQERMQTGKMVALKNKQTLPIASLNMRYSYNFAQVYWGGAAYFLNVDYQLYHQKNIRLSDVLVRYKACCRKNEDTLAHLITTLDGIVGAPIFKQTLEQQVLNKTKTKYFPDFQKQLIWLTKHPPKLVR